MPKTKSKPKPKVAAEPKAAVAVAVADPALDVQCDQCGAASGDECATPSGKKTKPHKKRERAALGSGGDGAHGPSGDGVATEEPPVIVVTPEIVEAPAEIIVRPMPTGFVCLSVGELQSALKFLKPDKDQAYDDEVLFRATGSCVQAVVVGKSLSLLQRTLSAETTIVEPFTVKWKPLRTLINSFHQYDYVTLRPTAVGENAFVLIENGTSSYRIQAGKDFGDWPVGAVLGFDHGKDGFPVGQFNKQACHKPMDLPLACVTTDAMRPAMLDLYIDSPEPFDPDNPVEERVVIATNGHVLAKAELHGSLPVDTRIHPWLVRYIRSMTGNNVQWTLLGEEGGEEQKAKNRPQYLITCGFDAILTYPHDPERYPQYRTVLPREEDRLGETVIWNAKQLIAAVERVMTSSSSITQLVALTLCQDAKTMLYADDSESGNLGREVLPFTYSPYSEKKGASFDIGFNGKYLIHMVKLLTPPLRFIFGSPNKAAEIIDAEGRYALIMPVMLNSHA